ncbi:MAG TPA: DUF937 domain-containing protein [Woeseiaceae bacterium]|nr:DUF937 domain-containing protein [Woeseiaceae bacterium]
MNLLDLLEQQGGGSSIATLAGKLGIDEQQARKLIGSLSPAMAAGLQQRAQSPEAQAGLASEIETGRYQRYLDEPGRLADDSAREDGNHVLGQLFGSKDVSRSVADRASRDTGLDAGLVKQALPMVAGLAMGALGRQAGQQGGLGGGLGSIAGLLDGDGDGKLGLGDLRRLF